MLAFLDLRHQQADPLGRVGPHGAAERVARFLPVARVDRRPRHRQRPLGMVGAQARQPLHALQPVEHGIAGPDRGVSLGELRVRRELPRRLEDAGGAADVAGAREKPRRHRCRRHQLRRQLVRFEREAARLVRFARLQFHGPRRVEHRAIAPCLVLVDDAAVGVGAEGCKRALPVPCPHLVFEERRARPADLRLQARRLLGEVARRAVLALPPRLDEEPMQAKHARVVLGRKRLEGRARRRAIAGDLGRLRGEQQHQRLAAEQRLRFLRRAPRRPHVPRAYRDHAPGQRAVAAVAPPRPEELPDRLRRVHHAPHQRADDGERRHDEHDHHRRRHQRRAHLVALPVEHQPARPFGKPHEARRQQEHQHHGEERADHASPGLGGVE
ncbi:MAG: hypothetical protein WDM84_00275 [Bauldia sp.]